MFEKEIKELFELCWEVNQETLAHARFQMGMGSLCEIFIQNHGYSLSSKFDGVYNMWISPELQEESMDDYRKAKGHLERLLREKGKIHRDENDSQ